MLTNYLVWVFLIKLGILDQTMSPVHLVPQHEKICEACKTPFKAKKKTTRFCESLRCLADRRKKRRLELEREEEEGNGP